MVNLNPKPSPYAGRWVARLQGKVIAHGGTPEAARRAAQASRHKEKPEILYMPLALSFSPLVGRLRAVFPDEEMYLVGGAVRDALLGRVSHDLDVAVPKDAIKLARRVANLLNADFNILDEGFDIARVIVSAENGSREFLDFAAFRGKPLTPSPLSPKGERGWGERSGQGEGGLDADLRGRDFTLNAIAFDLDSQCLLDPLNGAVDLRAKVLRACSPTSLSDDPIRILRAVRLAAAFDLKIEVATRKAMKQAVNLLPNVSPERQRDELFKILEGPRPADSLRALDALGVFQYFLPELRELKGVKQSPPHTQDVWEHTLSVIEELEELTPSALRAPPPNAKHLGEVGWGSGGLNRYRDQFASYFAASLNADRSVRALSFFAALYHDISKPATRSVDETGRIRFFDHDQLGAQVAAQRAQSLNLSNDEIARLKSIVKNHMRFHFFTARAEGEKKEPSRKAIYHFFRDAGDAGPDLVLLGLADLRGSRGDTLSQDTWNAALSVAHLLLENLWEKPQETVAPPRLLDGNDVMDEFHLEQGSLIGQLLEAIREAQAEGKVSTREEAIRFGAEWLKEHPTPSGLRPPPPNP